MKNGFTLAEVLIALVVIGIIAAVTLTTVMPNIQERVNSQRQANIVYKITQATNLMKANGAMINGFESTDAFVDELQKYLKIMKRCDSEHIADCWPTKKVRTSDGKEFEVKNAIERQNLGKKDAYKKNKNVGIVLADGASIIMTYNPGVSGISIGDKMTALTTILPIGGKFQTFLDYTSNTTGGLAFVMDVNGSKGPNSETIGSKMYDIRNLNGAHFDTGCGGIKVDGKCYTFISSIGGINCLSWLAEQNKYCLNDNGQNVAGNYSNNYWAGARAECDAMGAKLLSQNELYNICQSDELKRKYNLSSFKGVIWSSDNQASVGFEDDGCHKYTGGTTYSDHRQALCVE